MGESHKGFYFLSLSKKRVDYISLDTLLLAGSQAHEWWLMYHEVIIHGQNPVLALVLEYTEVRGSKTHLCKWKWIRACSVSFIMNSRIRRTNKINQFIIYSSVVIGIPFPSSILSPYYSISPSSLSLFLSLSFSSELQWQLWFSQSKFVLLFLWSI